MSACQSTPLETIEANVPEVSPSSPEALLQQADLANGREAARLYLSATESFIQANRLDEAARSFQRIDQALLSGARTADYRYAAAEIARRDGAVCGRPPCPAASATPPAMTNARSGS